MKPERLDKALAGQSTWSRREVRDWIRQGLVTVDGIPVKSPEQKLDWEQHRVAVAGKELSLRPRLYLMMNKPAGVVSASKTKTTRNNSLMAYVTVEDDTGSIELLAFARKTASCAEPGFFEFETAAAVQQFLEGIGLQTETGLAGTGVRALQKGGQTGPRVTVIGELDGIACPTHPGANPKNGIAHACGHNAQLTAMVGAAVALTVPEVAAQLCGEVDFFAVPAEEYVPVSVRQQLQQERGVEFCSGKMELIRLGAFCNTDIALTTHVHMAPSQKDLLLGNVACNGCVCKRVVFRGKAAHAAAAPHAGVNALNAAGLALSAIVFATLIGLVSGFSPANRAVKISALEAIKHE